MSEVKEEKEITTADLHEIVKQQGEQIETLKNALGAKKDSTIEVDKEQKVPEIPKDAVAVDGKEYKFNVAQFRLPKRSEVIFASQAILDKKILAEIIAIKGQNILKEQV